MSFERLLILQLIAHLIADFLLQTELCVRHKRMFGFRSKRLYLHVFIVFILSMTLSFQWNFIWASMAIALFHLLFDGLKNSWLNTSLLKKQAFFIDQALHLAVISGVTAIFSCVFTIHSCFVFPVSSHQLLIIAGYLFCMKPANLLIKEILNLYHINVTREVGQDLQNAGKLIGIIERVLTLTLVFIGQYSAVGFLLAAKSILRYEGAKTSKTEYVLIGTLLSFGLALLIAIGIQHVH